MRMRAKILLAVAAVSGQAVAMIKPVADMTQPDTIRPHDIRLAITLAHKSYDLAAQVYRPLGKGPFPLIVLNHGIPADKRKLAAVHPGLVRAARWFAGQGYIAVVALRPGFGSSSGRYLETSGDCEHQDYVLGARRTAGIEAAIVAAASMLPDVDARRIVVLGESAGGFGAIALADAPPPGVVGIINFAGGRGSSGKEVVCGGDDRIVAADEHFGAANRLPQLWLYAENDHYFRPALARRMAAAYGHASKPVVEFVMLPPFGEEGHDTLPNADPSVWSAHVAAFLDRVLTPR